MKGSADMMDEVYGEPYPTIPVKKCHNCNEFFIDRVNYRIMHDCLSIEEQWNNGMDFIYDEDFEKHNKEWHMQVNEDDKEEKKKNHGVETKLTLSKNQKKKLQKKRKSKRCASEKLNTEKYNKTDKLNALQNQDLDAERQLLFHLEKFELKAADGVNEARKQELKIINQEVDKLKQVLLKKLDQVEINGDNSTVNKDEACNQKTMILKAAAKQVHKTNKEVETAERVTEETTNNDNKEQVTEEKNHPADSDIKQRVSKKKCRHGPCSEAGLQRCSRCRSVSYCSEACSWAAWGDHREECDKEEEKRMRKKRRREKRLATAGEVD